MPSTPDFPQENKATPNRESPQIEAGTSIPTGQHGWYSEIRAMVGIVAGLEPIPQVRPAQVRTVWLLAILISLVLISNYYSSRLYGPTVLNGFFLLLGFSPEHNPVQPWIRSDAHLVDMLWWGGATAFGYLIPACIWLMARGEKIHVGMGWTRNGLGEHWPIYLIMAGVMVPALAFATHHEGFLHHYPFYRIPSAAPLWPRFFLWELIYTLQFFALESFFRGFVIGQLGKIVGGLAVPLAMVPYCMIHFGKPLPETLASIVAGLGLGTLSYRSGCIWPGAVLHITVAIAMDLAALTHQGRFS